jgi:CHAT domain-containing protein
MTKRLLFFITILLFFSFTDENRSLIEQQYNTLVPNLKSEPLKTLPSLESLYKKAEKSLDSRDTLLANLQFSLAKVYCDKNVNLAEGIRLYQKSLYIRREKLPLGSPKIGQTAGNLALASRQIGLFEQARSYAQLAIDAKQAATKIDTSSLVKSYNELGVSNRLLGSYADALAAANKVLELATAIKDSIFIANGHGIAGAAYYSTQKWADAATHYTQALHIQEGILKNNPSVFFVEKDKAATLNNLGTTYRELNQFDKSLAFLNQSAAAYLALFEKTKAAELNIYGANALFERAKTYNALKNKTQADADFQKAILQFANSNNPLSIECFTAYGDFLKKDGQLDAALKMYNQGIAAAFPSFKGGNDLNNPFLNTLAFPELLDIFSAKAFILKEKNELNAAFATFEKCDTLIQMLLNTYQADQSKYFLTEKALPIYENAIGLAFQFFEKNKTPQYINTAINFAEKNKALILLENLKDNKAKNLGGVPQNLLDDERNYRAEIAYIEKQLYEADSDSLKTKIENQLFNAKEKFNRFTRDLENKFPKYFDLKFAKNPPLSIKDIQNSLDAQTVAVSYFVGDSTLFSFAFAKNGVQFFAQKQTSLFHTDFQKLRHSLSNEKYINDSTALAEQTFCTLSHSFFNDLLKKTLETLNADGKLTRLRIVPDVFLGYLPFELLLTKPVTHWKGQDVPYLLRQYAVSYAYSLTLIDDTEGAFAAKDFGGFGIEYADSTSNTNINTPNPNNSENTRGDSTIIHYPLSTIHSSRGDVLSRLAFADDEVKNIKALLGGGQIWLNGGATKLVFMKNAPNCSILHLAMHGAIDEKNPLNSGLIFSKTDSTKDNFLSGYDLFAMQFKTGLAVLSACNTGNGELRRGEGVMSLARAFAYAGCPSTVMSLWSIPDESTSKVMLNFYKNLKNGDPKDIALQKAKLDYLENCPPQYSIPNEWGATVVIGNISPIDFRAWWEKPWIWLFGFSILGLFIFWFFRRKTLK